MAKKAIDLKRTKLHWMSEGSYGTNRRAEILFDNKVIAEASTDIAFDEKTKKTGFDILADGLAEKVGENWIGMNANMIRKAIEWASMNAYDCQVFIG